MMTPWAYTLVLLSQVDVLEQDAMEVLGLIRSMKNGFAPINRIPLDIFSLIPKYWDHETMDENLITLTHVCRGWRELFIARSWLWARLDCANVDKTRVYIRRAKSSRLEISLRKDRDESYDEGALRLAAAHIKRFQSLSIVGSGDFLQNLTKNLTRPAPSLEELKINLIYHPNAILDSMLFNADLSSLRTLRLWGVITHLPWKNLSKLTTFELQHISGDNFSITQLLDFFTNAPLLSRIGLFSIPKLSDAPPRRVVSLPSLERFTITANLAHSILLNHLSIPAGATLCLSFGFGGGKSPLPDFLPKTAKNLKNLLCITSVSLCFDETEKSIRLGGPAGNLFILGNWIDRVEATSLDLDSRILRSLDYFILSRIKRLTVMKYEPPALIEINKSSPYHILDRMKDLRTLILNRCNNLPFILALNPDQGPSNPVLCPKLEKLVLYVEERDSFNIIELTRMVKERALKDAELSSVTIVGLGELVPGKEVFKLREYVPYVDYRVGETSPEWHESRVMRMADRLGGHFAGHLPS